MIVPLRDELLLISGTRSFLLAAKANALFALRIETPDQEYCQTIEPSDIVVVSAPEGGALEPAIMLAEFVRTYHMPLIVLPKNHPGIKTVLLPGLRRPDDHDQLHDPAGNPPGTAPGLLERRTCRDNPQRASGWCGNCRSSRRCIPPVCKLPDVNRIFLIHLYFSGVFF